jgi:catechol 2,3-dioxygenase-like lactoylglutathione lyase family enzyme
MAIIGIESLVYGVTDVNESARFFDDFGLKRQTTTPTAVRFELPEGSSVVIRSNDDPAIPASSLVGTGVREVIWGVDTPESLASIAEDLGRDRKIHRDADGGLHFLTDFGAAMGLRVFHKKAVISAPDPINAPGYVRRLNTHRKWRLRAHPKVIAHVVFAVPDYLGAAQFMCKRMGFRLSDSQKGFGEYLRAGGSHNHHSLLLLNADLHFPGLDGQFRFHHANFGVEDIDEIMVGANHMTRCGWAPSQFGLGRHRIDSALFYYLPCPTGGEAEYGADADVVDESWVPREWTVPLFAYSHFVHNLPPFLMQAPEWTFRYITDAESSSRGTG